VKQPEENPLARTLREVSRQLDKQERTIEEMLSEEGVRATRALLG
jgi:hypothetical protein